MTSPSSSHRVVWLPPSSAAYTPPPMSPSRAHSAERVSAWIVIVLTFACSALAMFDLYLLMSASSPS
jgi:hypothetical protein